MDLKSELLKSIWYAFTSLEVERSGKVSKSQLKVLSHNLYTALNIPHDPVALEEHFQDNDNGPVSDHGYMPYLNKYILAKATEGTFNKETFDELCWMLTSKKNFKPSILQGVCSQKDCFRLFCLFNLLSEDHYPLHIIQPELEYLLKKISTAMNQEWDGKLLEDLLSHDPSLQDGLSVWVFLEHLSAGRLMQVVSKEAFSMALEDVFMEMYHNVLKKGYMLKRGHVRRSWQERWFMLKPSVLVYYTSEDQKEKKGEVLLDGNCAVEPLTDKEGKRCLFCVKTPGRTYEISATDQKQKVEWIQSMQTALRLKAERKSSLHQELKLRRREQRELSLQSAQNHQSVRNNPSRQNSQNGQISQAPSNQSSLPNQSPVEQTVQRSLSRSSQSDPASEMDQPRPVDQQGEPETNEPDLEIINIIQQHLEMEAQRKKEEALEKEKQNERQQEMEKELKEANMAREKMVIDLAKMEKEVEQQKKRIEELELTQLKMEEALNTQIQARLEEEKARHELERLLEEERRKLNELILLQKNLEAPVQTEHSEDKTPEEEDEEEEEEEEEDDDEEEEEDRVSSSVLPLMSPVVPPSSNPEPTTCSDQAPAQTEETHHYRTEKVLEIHSKAPYMRQWNVQLNRLMKPITPADKMERLQVRSNFPKHDQALTSAEFILKYQSSNTQETESSNSLIQNKDEGASSEEPVSSPETEKSALKTRKQTEHSPHT